VRVHGAKSAKFVNAEGSGKASTCLREAAFSLRSHFGEGGTAKAGNAAGDFFQLSWVRLW